MKIVEFPNTVHYFTMTGAVEGKWIEMWPLQNVKAGHVSLLFDDEYIVHIGGSQDGRLGMEQIEVWRYQSTDSFKISVTEGDDGRLAYWQYWPNSFKV